MDHDYTDDLPLSRRQREERNERDIKIRGEIEANTNPFQGKVIKKGTYQMLQEAQKECDKKIREALGQISSAQDKIAEVIETQKRIQEALEINKPQNRVDKDKQKGEER